MYTFDSFQPTVGIDFLAKNLFHKNRNFRLQLWDTAGQERFRSLIPSYLKDAISALIVYDVTSKQSLVNAERWLKLYNDNKVSEGYSILVGNKIDLSYRTVTPTEGQAVAASLKIDYFEISAKTG
jgi:Ras-related protein Rab-6A